MQRGLREPKIAFLLNKGYVSILVDRQERPDVDNAYMTFVQAVTGRGGWPMTVFLTPGAVPFVGSTFLPPDRLASALESISARWTEQRSVVEADGAKVLEALRALSIEKRARLDDLPLGAETLQVAFDAACTSFDATYGGFGPPPKFPRAPLFEYLFGTHLLYGRDSAIGAEAMSMLDLTLTRMCEGGIHDAIGGGFFRYSMDAAWTSPNYEKLLSDQAQLALSYLFAYCISGNLLFKRVVMSTLDFCLDELLIAETGAFASALDADSLSMFDVGSIDGEAQEGAFYSLGSWEVKLMLGEPSATAFCMRYGISPAGNMIDTERAAAFEGMNIARVSASIEDIAAKLNLSAAEVMELLDVACRKLREERNRRPRPAIDDTDIVSWNAMAVSALVRAGRALSEPRYLDAGFRTMDHILDHMVSRVDAKLDAVFLSRTFRSGQGRGRVDAFAEDYATAIEACIDCFEASSPATGARYLSFALKLQRALDAAFWDVEGGGGYMSSSEDDQTILIRRKEDYDGSEPAASSVSALNCVRLASLTGCQELWKRARHIAAAFSYVVTKTPLAMPLLLVSVQSFASEGSKKVVILGDDEQAASFLTDFWRRGLPRSVALLRIPVEGVSDELAAVLSGGRKLIRSKTGEAMAYVCTGAECLEPTTSTQKFREQLDYLQHVQVPGALPH
jgi:uncharacterized protein